MGDKVAAECMGEVKEKIKRLKKQVYDRRQKNRPDLQLIALYRFFTFSY